MGRTFRYSIDDFSPSPRRSGRHASIPEPLWDEVWFDPADIGDDDDNGAWDDAVHRIRDRSRLPRASK